jgi:hypothetical protein
MALTVTDLLLTVPLPTFVLYLNVAITGLSPWVSWADTRSNFSRVVQVLGIYWRADPYSAAAGDGGVRCSLHTLGLRTKLSKTRAVGGIYDGKLGAQFDWVRFSLSFFSYSCLSLPQRNIQIPPHVLLRSRHPPRLHPKGHAKTRLVRLLLGHVCVVWRDLAARVRCGEGGDADAG